MKYCPDCQQTKPFDEFYKKGRNADYLNSSAGYDGFCKSCRRTRQIAWRKKYPQKAKNVDLKSYFGIGIEQYNEMFSKQDGRCGICRRHQSGFSRALAVDHCHNTGKIRGLLCMECNHAIGQMDDDPERLISAANYLKADLAALPGIVVPIKSREKVG